MTFSTTSIFWTFTGRCKNRLGRGPVYVFDHNLDGNGFINESFQVTPRCDNVETGINRWSWYDAKASWCKHPGDLQIGDTYMIVDPELDYGWFINCIKGKAAPFYFRINP